MMKHKRLMLGVLAVLCFCSICWGYSADYCHADDAAAAAMNSSANVSVEQKGNALAFISEDAELGLIFYPGGKVEYGNCVRSMNIGMYANSMFLCGPVIPIRNPALLLTNGIGLITPITLDKPTKGAINKLWRVSMDKFLNVALPLVLLVFVAVIVYTYIRYKKKPERRLMGGAVLTGVVCVLYFLLMKMNQTFAFALAFTDVPVATLMIILIVCLLLTYLSRTKLGSDINAVGQNRQIAESMGIPVDKIRIIAVIISTVLAGLGQMIFIQDIGNFTTYTAHENVGTFAIAALLVGGASITKATIGQVVLGALLFHTIFIFSPIAGKNIFNNAQIGEYFRVFASYAVIAIALVLHAWKTAIAKKESELNDR